MPSRQSASVRGDHDADQPNCTPTRATTSPTAGRRYAGGGSFHASPGVASRAMSALADTDG